MFERHSGLTQATKNAGGAGATRGAARLENLGQLVSSVKTYADQRGRRPALRAFGGRLISDIDSYDEETDVVVMMTMHAAKRPGI